VCFIDTRKILDFIVVWSILESKRPKRGVGQCVPTSLYVCGMYVGCMYVGCNHDPGQSVIGVPDPRRTETISCQESTSR
jgi:hypothetical protein